SKAKKINEHRVYALDWNIELECFEEVRDDIKYIGIRSHHIDRCQNENLENYFELKIVGFIDDLFNKTITLSNGNQHIFMDLSKEEYNKIKNEKSINVNIN